MRYTPEEFEVARTLDERGHLDEFQLAAASHLPLPDVREALRRLSLRGVVDTTEKGTRTRYTVRMKELRNQLDLQAGDDVLAAVPGGQQRGNVVEFMELWPEGLPAAVVRIESTTEVVPLKNLSRPGSAF